MLGLYSLIITILLSGQLAFAAGGALGLPLVVAKANSSFSVSVIYGSAPMCHDLFNAESLAYRTTARENTRMVVKAANREFERRGWSAEFLEERFALAKRFEDQSEYVYVSREGKGIVATMGLTYAEYTKHTLPASDRLAVESRERSQILPEEESLQLRPLARPLSHDEKGLIVELRTWSIAKDLLEATERGEAFGELLARTLLLLFLKLEKYPDLYDQPILHLYADETSLKLYGMMGFEVTHENPVPHEGSNWWDMAMSPRKFESFVKRLRDADFISSLNQELEIKLTNGRTVALAAGSFARGRNSNAGREGEFQLGETIGNLARAAEVEPGIFAAKGAMVIWYPTGQLAYVSKLERPLLLVNGLRANAGSAVGWIPDGRVFKVTRLAQGAQVAPGFWVAKSGSVEWYADGSSLLKITRLARPVKLENGLIASAGATVEWKLAGAQLNYVSRLERDGRLEDGTIAAAGAEVRWSMDWDAGRVRWEMVSKIAKPSEVYPGHVAPAGSRVYFFKFTEPPGIHIED